MKRFTLIIILITAFVFCQDRSIIFNTGSPDSTIGHLSDINNSVAMITCTHYSNYFITL